MKVTIKTLQQKVFQIETTDTETVGDLKGKIAEQQGHPVETQKIIFSGKVLADDKTIASCSMKEKDFLVLMVSKPKPTPAAPSVATPAAAPAPVPAPVPVPAPTAEVPASAPLASEPSAPAPAAEATEAAVASASSRAFGDTSSFISGGELQQSINNMVEMGFEREQVMRALRASFNNPDRAVEYLFNGIPAHLEAEASRQPGAPQGAAPTAAPVPAPTAPTAPAAVQPAAQPAAPAAPQNLFQLAQQQQQQQGRPAGPGGRGPGLAGLGGAGAGAGGAGLDFGALRESPEMQGVRDMLAQNPMLIQPMLQELGARNPQLAQAIAANPGILFQLFGGEEGEGAEGEGGAAGLPHETVVHVTPEERAAIERLEALGFTRQQVLEAYLLCDKNEEMAANYLFDNGFEDEA